MSPTRGCLDMCLYGIRELASATSWSNQSEHSIWTDPTNESGPVCPWELTAVEVGGSCGASDLWRDWARLPRGTGPGSTGRWGYTLVIQPLSRTWNRNMVSTVQHSSSSHYRSEIIIKSRYYCCCDEYKKAVSFRRSAWNESHYIIILTHLTLDSKDNGES